MIHSCCLGFQLGWSTASNLHAYVAWLLDEDVKVDLIWARSGWGRYWLSLRHGICNRSSRISNVGRTWTMVVKNLFFGNLGGGGIAGFVGVDIVWEHVEETCVRHIRCVILRSGRVTAVRDGKGPNVVGFAVVVPGEDLRDHYD